MLQGQYDEKSTVLIWDNGWLNSLKNDPLSKCCNLQITPNVKPVKISAMDWIKIVFVVQG